YLNYEFLHIATGGVRINSFGFDDVTSETTTNNPPKDANGIIAMTVTPAVQRVLGPCLADTDLDGIFDIYEDVNQNDNLADDNTDGDEFPNFRDSDDDGDGILSKFERNDDNHNGLPDDAFNTDQDALADYLDADDDNDGYATWETHEGGPGITNTTTPGSVYTLDSDNDGTRNYLDTTNGLFTEVRDMEVKNYLSLTGDKRYELANHLGNVLVVANDKLIPGLDQKSLLTHFNADVLSYSDYDPFGMLVPNRHAVFGNYRYGFQGQEKDDELKGEGNSLNYELRMLDTRVGRFFTVDPYTAKYPWYTPYQFAGNKVIQFVELEGGEEAISGAGSDITTMEGSKLQEVLVSNVKPPTFWSSFGHTLVKGLVVTVTVVAVVALIATTGPVGVAAAAALSDVLLVAGVATMTKDGADLITGKDIFTGKELTEAEQGEKAAGLVLGITMIGAGKLSKVNASEVSETGAPELNKSPLDAFKGNKLSEPEMTEVVGAGSKSAVYEPTGSMVGKKVGHTFSKHGSNNTFELVQQAKGSNSPQGQWLNDAAAEEFISSHLADLKNGAENFDLPEGLGRVVNPDGTFTPATQARLVPSKSGVLTAYPGTAETLPQN
ncbi:pre-toxin TG domain-containing protein, partial [Flavobacterium sp.]|uniref:pre-toxin TG domain-containing protein n=1 Tax=Flavobacterium sp. TaxID=239 RepID=UPI003D6BEEFB